jgi:hypothetical protein
VRQRDNGTGHLSLTRLAAQLASELNDLTER